MISRRCTFGAAAACLVMLAASIHGTVHATELRVGPGLYYTRPSEAAKDAKDGDVILIEPGIYRNDTAVWRANDITIKATNSGVAHIRSDDGRTAMNKALWVIRGDRVTVERISFSGAASSHHNGAGIRAEGMDLTIIGCTFTENDMGILTGHNPKSTIVIRNSVFHDNGRRITRPELAAHNIYIGRIKRFVLFGSRSTGASLGHTVKSRARENVIAYNHIADHHDGRASYLIDLPEGGESLLIGNVIQQGPRWENDTLVSFAAEKKGEPVGTLTMAHNTLVNTAEKGIFLRNYAPATAVLVNNLLVGPGEVARGEAETRGNVRLPDGPDDAQFADPDAFDYRPTPGSPAVDTGVETPPEWTPSFSFHHPTGRTTERVAIGTAPDAGAFEAGDR